jgi:hypothetical protein
MGLETVLHARNPIPVNLKGTPEKEAMEATASWCQNNILKG